MSKLADKSEMLLRHMEALKEISGRQVEAGWFESARYDAGEDGKEGIQVARVARQLEYGGTIDHPGGTKYIRDAATKDRYLGTRFVKKDFKGEHEVTKAHKIVIPPRPFMRLAWSNFSANRSSIQSRLCRDFINGKIDAQTMLEQIGMTLQGYISKSIVNGNWQPNAPSTARKKGFNKPLIDTSHMLQSVQSKVMN